MKLSAKQYQEMIKYGIISTDKKGKIIYEEPIPEFKEMIKKMKINNPAGG